MKNYCGRCNKISASEIREVNESLPVKGERINVKSKVAFCKNCGNEVFDPELDENNLNAAYNSYCKKHNLLAPSEISAVRKKYALSQRSLARLLEWGEITIHRYEKGSIQDPVHNEVLMLIDDPRNMEQIFKRNSQFLNQNAREKLREKLNELTGSGCRSDIRVSVEDLLRTRRRSDEFTGFVNFNLDKMISIILYIADKTGGVFTTKLNKLLFYSDFLNFKKKLVSMSGSPYVHLPLGPVPDSYEWIIAAAKSEGLWEEEIIFPGGYAGSNYKSISPPDISILNEDEREVIDFVLGYFKNFNCKKIKELSHREKAYRETKPNEIISYKFARQLSIKC